MTAGLRLDHHMEGGLLAVSVNRMDVALALRAFS